MADEYYANGGFLEVAASGNRLLDLMMIWLMNVVQMQLAV
jgi:hypothetical protein